MARSRQHSGGRMDIRSPFRKKYGVYPATGTNAVTQEPETLKSESLGKMIEQPNDYHSKITFSTDSLRSNTI